MESILETEAATILQFFAGLRGTLSVTFEEGTWSAGPKTGQPGVVLLVCREPFEGVFLVAQIGITPRFRKEKRSRSLTCVARGKTSIAPAFH
jgi:hypothetical protein